ncbi:MAG: hypothetical protein RBT63_08940 [Bdellovibrionales bacterium]|jgi:hypothetical protein|nr:hypothetical protein [Bdellovibrionales bacterium]
MKFLKRALLLFSLCFASLAVSLLTVDQKLEKHGGMAHVTSSLEAMKLRHQYPDLPLNIAYARAQQETVSASTHDGSFVNVRANREAILKKPTDQKGHVSNIEKGKKVIDVSPTQDGREAIAIVNEASAHDPAAIDRIMSLNIPEDMRNKILKNYKRTGVLPEILVRKEKRAPANADDSPRKPYDFEKIEFPHERAGRRSQ